MSARSAFVGHRAVYKGPYASVTDEQGQPFRRNEPAYVSADAAAKLEHPPYAASFTVYEPDGSVARPVRAKRLLVASASGGCP